MRSRARVCYHPSVPPERPLSDAERALYEWQTWVPDFGEAGQRRLKAATVLVSRCGGVGGSAAYALAAAGVGRLVLAHAGNLRANDLNRQLLMNHAGIGLPRVELAAERLKALNPFVDVEIVAENVSEANAAALVAKADVVVSAAPLFAERYLLNREAVRQGRPLVDCAMYELEGRLMTVVPGKTACLACVYPADPQWKREFPVFGAVSAAVGSLGAMEAIKLIAGMGEPGGKMLAFDLRDWTFRAFAVQRRTDCDVCGK
jgi:molybdopterin/thiamine biosynthesis adenylyltransferase